MNIIQRGLKRLIGEKLPDATSTLATGDLKDKRDVEDPTGKFCNPRIISRQERYSKLRKNVSFSRPEYDLPTIANAVQMDGILQRAVSLFTEQILKNGYDCVSKDDKAQRHLNKRLREVQGLTGVPFYETMNQIARQLVTYGNAFVIKVRSTTKSRYGKSYRLYNRTFDPIVGLFVADATTMEIGINDREQVVNYKQRIHGNEYIWDEREVIHIAYNKIPGTLTGMSSIIPILDDVRALRKLEEEIEILGFQYSIPLYLYKVGNKDMQPGPGEIDSVRDTVNNMPAYGMLVVPGHHDIVVPNNDNTPIDLISFVNHFKTRIFAGLGVSPVAMAEVSTSNRNTSEVMDISMQTITKRYQQLIKHRLEMDLFREILLDGKFDVVNTDIEFHFPEIDLEAQIKKETNIIQKWQNDLITRTEARMELDMESSLSDEDTFLHLIEIPKIQAQGDIQVETAQIGAKASLQRAKSSGASSSSTKKKKTTDTKVRPANQHGKSSGRPKYVRDELSYVLEDADKRSDLLLRDNGYRSNLNRKKFLDKLVSSTRSAVDSKLQRKVRELCDFHHVTLDDSTENISDSFVNVIELILEDKIKRLSPNLDSDIKIDRFNQDIKDFVGHVDDKIDNLSRLLVYKSLGFSTILVNADTCECHTTATLPINDLTFTKIPPFKANCKCNVSEKRIYEFNDTKID